MKCTGATGWMSWNASTSSSSYTFLPGISPRTILQKMQLGSVAMPSYCIAARPPRPPRAVASAAARGLFGVPRRPLAARELGQHVGGRQAVPHKQHEAMEPEVGDFGGDARRDRRPWRPSPSRWPPRRSSSGSRRRPWRTATRRRNPTASAPRARRDRSRPAARARRRWISHRRRSPSGPSARARHHATRRSSSLRKKQRSWPGVAGDAADLLDDEHDRVAVAIEADLAHALHVAGRLALAPQLAARARPVVRLARVARCARAPRDSSTRASAPVRRRRPARSPATRPSAFQRTSSSQSHG